MTLLNTCSLRKHLDAKLSDNHLLCNRPTRNSLRRTCTDLILKLGTNNVQNHRYIDIAYSNRMQLLDNEGMIILKSLITKFSLWPVKLDLLDRSQKSPVSAFLA